MVIPGCTLEIQYLLVSFLPTAREGNGSHLLEIAKRTITNQEAIVLHKAFWWVLLVSSNSLHAGRDLTSGARMTLSIVSNCPVFFVTYFTYTLEELSV